MRGQNQTRVRVHIRNMKRNQAPSIDWDKKPFKPLEYIRIRSDLLHDPDFFMLTVEQRYLWLMLLLHAGRVGLEYELTISSMRVLFQLRPGWRGVDDLRVLENQGFITLSIVEKREDKKRREEKRQPLVEPLKAVATVLPKEPDRFVEFWELYPNKTGKKPCKAKWKARKLDRIADQIIESVRQRIEHDRKFIDYTPNPLTYINQDRWDDPIQRTPGKTEKLLSGLHKWAEDQPAEENGNG